MWLINNSTYNLSSLNDDARVCIHLSCTKLIPDTKNKLHSFIPLNIKLFYHIKFCSVINKILKRKFLQQKKSADLHSHDFSLASNLTPSSRVDLSSDLHKCNNVQASVLLE